MSICLKVLPQSVCLGQQTSDALVFLMLSSFFSFLPSLFLPSFPSFLVFPSFPVFPSFSIFPSLPVFPSFPVFPSLPVFPLPPSLIWSSCSTFCEDLRRSGAHLLFPFPDASRVNLRRSLFFVDVFAQTCSYSVHFVVSAC